MNDEISAHEVRLFRVLRDRPERWFTSKEVASEAKVAGRTARAYLLKFHETGIAEMRRVHPSHLYRWNARAQSNAREYFDRLNDLDRIMTEREKL